MELLINNELVDGQEDTVVAGALLKNGYHTLLSSSAVNTKGIYCGMGVCFNCLSTINQTGFSRSCIKQVQPGMVVET